MKIELDLDKYDIFTGDRIYRKMKDSTKTKFKDVGYQHYNIKNSDVVGRYLRIISEHIYVRGFISTDYFIPVMEHQRKWGREIEDRVTLAHVDKCVYDTIVAFERLAMWYDNIKSDDDRKKLYIEILYFFESRGLIKDLKDFNYKELQKTFEDFMLVHCILEEEKKE